METHVVLSRLTTCENLYQKIATQYPLEYQFLFPLKLLAHKFSLLAETFSLKHNLLVLSYLSMIAPYTLLSVTRTGAIRRIIPREKMKNKTIWIIIFPRKTHPPHGLHTVGDIPYQTSSMKKNMVSVGTRDSFAEN